MGAFWRILRRLLRPLHGGRCRRGHRRSSPAGLLPLHAQSQLVPSIGSTLHACGRQHSNTALRALHCPAAVAVFEAGATLYSAAAPAPPPTCADVAPPGLLSCSEQQAWGMCVALNATAFCARTCGQCTPGADNALPCDDIPTPDAMPCSQVRGVRAAAGGVGTTCWPHAACMHACMDFAQPVLSPACAAAALNNHLRITDSKPSPTARCLQTLADGRCSSPYVKTGGYCRATCGACQQGEGGAAVQTVQCDDVPTPDGVTCIVRSAAAATVAAAVVGVAVVGVTALQLLLRATCFYQRSPATCGCR